VVFYDLNRAGIVTDQPEGGPSMRPRKGYKLIPLSILLAATHMDNKLLTAAINILEARANQMVTAEEWKALAQAVKEETGQYVEWRNRDELRLSDTMTTWRLGR
jgi:hypothetical protein